MEIPLLLFRRIFCLLPKFSGTKKSTLLQLRKRIYSFLFLFFNSKQQVPNNNSLLMEEAITETL